MQINETLLLATKQSNLTTAFGFLDIEIVSYLLIVSIVCGIAKNNDIISEGDDNNVVNIIQI